MGTVDMGADEYVGTHYLAADVFSFPASTGGIVVLTLDAGSSNGNRGYGIFGSVTGNNPGATLPGNQARLPINWDSFTDFVIQNWNTPVFQYFLGNLDSYGKATATFNTFGSTPVATFSFAYALNNSWNVASNPVNIEAK